MLLLWKKITSSRNNLERHEKVHAPNVKKVKCLAQCCDSTFANKSNYWIHWTTVHKNMKMPDKLEYVMVPKKPMKLLFQEEAEIAENYPFSKPTDFFVLNSLGLFHKHESKIVLYFDQNACFGEMKLE